MRRRERTVVRRVVDERGVLIVANNDVETRVTELEKKFTVQDEKFNAFLREMSDFKQEMRDRDNQRAAEIRELRQAQAAQSAKHEEAMRQINDRIDKSIDGIRGEVREIRSEVRNIFLVAAIGIGAMILTVVAPLVFSSVKSAEAPNPAPKPAVYTQMVDRGEHDDRQ